MGKQRAETSKYCQVDGGGNENVFQILVFLCPKWYSVTNTLYISVRQVHVAYFEDAIAYWDADPVQCSVMCMYSIAL